MNLSYVVMDPQNCSQFIEIRGKYNPEEDYFEPTNAIVGKAPRSMDMFELFQYAGIIDTLIENVDFREIYRQQKFQYA